MMIEFKHLLMKLEKCSARELQKLIQLIELYKMYMLLIPLAVEL
jgi:hypothetical protein